MRRDWRKNPRAVERRVRALVVTVGAAAAAASMIGACSADANDDNGAATEVVAPDGSRCTVHAEEISSGPNPCDGHDHVIEGTCAWPTGTLLDADLCRKACGLDGAFPQCNVTTVGAQKRLVCRELCVVDGRHPASFVSGAPAQGESLASLFVRMAYFEAASAHDFEQLAVGLRAHGAPRALVRDARRAASEERRHARMARALARRFGATRAALCAACPEPRAHRSRALASLARENAREGAAREALSTVLGHYQSTHAEDRAVRAAMAIIARDEIGHAALSYRIHAWAMGQLSPSSRSRIERARRNALTEMGIGVPALPPSALRAIGWPDASTGERLTGAARALFSDAA